MSFAQSTPQAVDRQVASVVLLAGSFISALGAGLGILASAWARPTAPEFSERCCRGGDLGTIEARHLMSLALAHAGRLSKLGA